MTPPEDGRQPASSRRVLRINTAELLRQPGQRRELKLALGAADVELDTDHIPEGEAVEVHLVAESTLHGIRVTGSVSVPRDGECRRCLRPLRWVEHLDVEELYQEQITEPDAYELGPDALDLTPLVRDLALLAQASPPPLCRADCAGLCPVCGVDRNERSCSCETAVTDERWAALDQLELPDE